MALVSFFSAKGAPGATTTAMLVAALWPRPTLLVDADGAGGDVGLRLTSPAGTPLTRNPGLLTLLPLARHGLVPGVVLDHSQVALGGQRVLVGLENPAQAEAAGALWPTLAQAFHDLPGMDVVIDAGRLNHRSFQLPLLQRSDVVVGVVRADPTSVVHMRQRLSLLHETFAPLGAEGPRLGLVCVEDVQHQGEAASAVQTVAAELPDVLDLGQVALDPKAVRMFHGEPVYRPERSMIVRSGHTLVERLLAAAGPALAPPGVPYDVTHPVPDPPATNGVGPGAAEHPPDTHPADEAGNAPAEPADGIPDGEEGAALRRPRRQRRRLFR